MNWFQDLRRILQVLAMYINNEYIRKCTKTNRQAQNPAIFTQVT